MTSLVTALAPLPSLPSLPAQPLHHTHLAVVVFKLMVKNALAALANFRPSRPMFRSSRMLSHTGDAQNMLLVSTQSLRLVTLLMLIPYFDPPPET